MEQVGRFNAELSEESHDAWRQFAARHGVTMTAVAEALGPLLGGEIDWPALIERARQINTEREDRSTTG